MWRPKLKIQIVLCLVLAVLYGAARQTDIPLVEKQMDKMVAAVSTHYTAGDLAESGKKAAAAIIQMPVAVTNQVIASQEAQKYGLPIEAAEDGETVSVYAVAGGIVSETGESEELGNYVILQHDNQISVYGNCSKIYVKSAEHVRKGQVIASYTESPEKDFIYQLKDQ